MLKTKQIKASQIAKFLKSKLYGKDIIIKKPISVYDLSSNCLSFVKKEFFNESLIGVINKHPLSLIICHPRFKNKIKSSFILSERPYHEFSKAIKEFFACPEPKIVIGKNCLIKPSAVIGEEAFSYQRNEKGILEQVAQIGGVKIGDNVEIGSFTVIERGILTDTCIGSNVKIVDLVHIGHNSVIGERTQIVTGAVLAGGVIIGKNCFIGINASIKQRIKIGDNVFIGMGAVVVKDVSPGTTVIGNPARPLTRSA